MCLFSFCDSLARAVHVVWFGKAMLPRSLLLLISIWLTILYLVSLLLLLIWCTTANISQAARDYLCIRQFRWINALVWSVAIGSWLHLMTSTRHRRPLVNFVKCARCALVLPRWCCALRCWIIHHLWVIVIDRVLLVVVGVNGAKLSIRTSHICWMFMLWRWSLLRWTLHIPSIISILFIATWVHF